MKRVAVVGGETHLQEITKLQGSEITIIATCMKDEYRAEALPHLHVPNYADEETMLAEARPEIVAIANENDRKFASIMYALRVGCDVIMDKPLCLTQSEQDQIEEYLAAHPQRRLLHLLTLRGHPLWVATRDKVQEGVIGTPVFVHVRMAVQLNRAKRPPWFLDVRRSGGIFLDLLIHGIDQVEWLTGARITAVTANHGNLGNPTDIYLQDHGAVYCELDNGGSAVVEGQRLLPDTKGSDYRALVVGTKGYIDMSMGSALNVLRITNAAGADVPLVHLPPPISIVSDWLRGGEQVPQEASLRANRLSLLATESAAERCRIAVGSECLSNSFFWNQGGNPN